MNRTALLVLFGAILAIMLAVTSWASFVQPLWEWQGLTRVPDHAWTLATLVDAYCGFITFCVWVFYKERSWGRRVLWFVAIMALGNMAMAGYVLMRLVQLPRGADVTQLLTQRHG